jgi:D-threo-aldose 1-dehydrogenase
MNLNRKLGNTDLLCPPVIYGTSYLGNLYRELSWEEKLSIMKEWFRVGGTNVMIDSAGKYGAGLALEVIGKGLSQLNIPADQITISNKLGWYRVPLETEEPTFEPGAWASLKYDAVQKISYYGILDCWDQGCELLGGKYKPQRVSVHDPDEYLQAAADDQDRQKRKKDILDAYEALFGLKKAGQVKAVGIGAKDWTVIRELYEDVHFDWVMFANKLTLLHHPPEILEFMERLYDEGVGIINSAIFNAGFITGGDYFDYRKVEPDDFRYKVLFEWRDKFFSICEKFNVSPGDACLKFGFSAPFVSAVALNPSKPKRIAHNMEVLQKEISPEFWAELKKQGVIDPEYKYV